MPKPIPARVLIDEKEIQKRVREIGAQISKDYAGREPVLVGVLKGSVVFMADLARAITIPHTFDFIRASSYGSGIISSGNVEVTHNAQMDLSGRHLIVAEDIYDTGRTLGALIERLQTQKPASLEVACLIIKNRKHEVNADIRYQGFHLPDQFIVGYGLDFNEQYRHLRHIAELDMTEQ